jgi:hypothetical protein
MLDTQTGNLSGSAILSGLAAAGATISNGIPGDVGTIVVSLAETPAGSGTWAVPAGTRLSADQITAFSKGSMHVNATSVLYPSGEIRGQLGLDTRTANLTGTQQNPAVATNATGYASLGVDSSSQALSGTVNVSGLVATAVRIHAGTVGNNGDPIVTLGESPAGSGKWVIPAGTTLSSAQSGAFQSGGLYVNVTSATAPGGELRGQVGRIVIDSRMSAAQEVPSNASIGTATVRVTIDPITREMNGIITTTNMPTANNAHIHTGLFGVSAGVTYPFTQTAPGAATWSMAPTTLTPAQLQTVLFGNTYANVHSPAFPGGEIRGQVGNIVRTAILSGAQEVPPNASAGIGRIRVDINPVTLDITVALATSGLSPTVAHIHQGAAGVVAGVAIPFIQVSPGNWTTNPGAKATLAQATAFAAGGTYANVHSATFPGGEIRAQLTGLN